MFFLRIILPLFLVLFFPLLVAAVGFLDLVEEQKSNSCSHYSDSFGGHFSSTQEMKSAYNRWLFTIVSPQFSENVQKCYNLNPGIFVRFISLLNDGGEERTYVDLTHRHPKEVSLFDFEGKSLPIKKVSRGLEGVETSIKNISSFYTRQIFGSPLIPGQNFYFYKLKTSDRGPSFPLIVCRPYPVPLDQLASFSEDRKSIIISWEKMGCDNSFLKQEVDIILVAGENREINIWSYKEEVSKRETKHMTVAIPPFDRDQRDLKFLIIYRESFKIGNGDIAVESESIKALPL